MVKRRAVAVDFCMLPEFRTTAARMWATVSRKPPRRMVFLGPREVNKKEGTIPTRTLAFTAKENYKI